MARATAKIRLAAAVLQSPELSARITTVIGLSAQGRERNMTIKTVFLSSTFKDLHEYREAVYQAIQKLDGYMCVRMEDFGARAQTADEFCQQTVAECDMFVGIVGHCYGSCPKGSNESFAEREYNLAVETNKPCLMFLAPENFPIPANLIRSMKSTKQRAFRKRIADESIHAPFKSPESLAGRVVQAIHNWDRENLWQERLQERERRARRQERNRIRDEIHDSAFGALIRLRLAADEAISAPSAEMRNVLSQIPPRARRIYEELEIALGIRTREEEAEEEEIRAAVFIRNVERLCNDCEKDYKIEIDRDFQSAVVKLIPPIFLQILRNILSLQLDNVWEHAEATRVQVNLEPDRPIGKKPRLVKFTISDNGKGCDFSLDSLSPDDHSGLVSSREKVKRAGGSLEIYSEPGDGFTLTVEIPLS